MRAESRIAATGGDGKRWRRCRRPLWWFGAATALAVAGAVERARREGFTRFWPGTNNNVAPALPVDFFDAAYAKVWG